MNLEKLNLVELNAQEMRKTEGGWLQAALAIAGAAIYLYNEGGDFIKGYKQGRNS
ncbi:TPA: class IIb bacteriocin, lactobin A/cerein 7B family [Elizabethkingia anophelis]